MVAPTFEGRGISAAVLQELGVESAAALMGPNSRAYFVRAANVGTFPNSTIEAIKFTSITAAMAACRANMNDVILVLPGHTENISSTWTANLVAGTRIVGIGDVRQTNAPTLTFNATGSTVAVDVANVVIAGLRWAVSVDGVTEGFGVNAAGFKFLGNYADVAPAESTLFAIFMDLEVGATDAEVKDNIIKGTSDDVTNVLLVSGANDGVTIEDNYINTSQATAVGGINVTAAATNLAIRRNSVTNSQTSSTAAISIGNVAATGVCERNTASITTATAAAAAAAITQGAAGLVAMVENYGIGEHAQHSAILTPVVTDGL